MVNYCAMIGCKNTGGRDKVSFYRLPAVISHQGEKTQELSERRRRTWLSRIGRDDVTAPSYQYIRVCSAHFVKGKQLLHFISRPIHNLDVCRCITGVDIKWIWKGELSRVRNMAVSTSLHIRIYFHHAHFSITRVAVECII